MRKKKVINSAQGIILRKNRQSLSGKYIKQLTANYAGPLLEDNEDLAISGDVSKDSIDF